MIQVDVGTRQLTTMVRLRSNTSSTTGRRYEVRMPCATCGTRFDSEDIPVLKKVRALPLYLDLRTDHPLVWPVIATHLEFKPQSSGPAGSDKEDSK